MVYWIASFLLGAIAVLQGGLNRQITRSWGLSSAIFLNSIILLGFAFIFLFICRTYPDSFPSHFANKWSAAQWRWWFVIPGLCGFALVAGIPALIPKLGAVGVFLCIVIGQMTFSLVWDLKAEQIPIEPQRIYGLILALAGLFVSYWKNPFS